MFARDIAHTRSGLRRLFDHGLRATAEFPYANTATGPGHATLGTGVAPNQHGIIANAWFERDAIIRHEAIDDKSFPVFQLGTRQTQSPGVSPERLRVEGVADVLKRERPDSRAVAVGFKDRAPVLMLGRKPDVAVFVDETQPAVTTSRFYGDKPPDWLLRFNEKHPLSSYFGGRWELLDRALTEKVTGIPDNNPGEPKGSTFPYQFNGDESGEMMGATPAGTNLVFDLAEAAVQANRLGQRGVPDLLGIGVSSHDIAGHTWGQESWERFDLFLRLDRRLGVFFDFLDKTVGRNHYAVVLTGDHGAAPLVNLSQKKNIRAARVASAAVVATANQAVSRVVGSGIWFKGLTGNTLYETASFHALSDEQRERALDAVVSQVKNIPNIGFVERSNKLIGDCEQREGIAKAACLSLDPEQSGVVFVVPARYSVWAPVGYETGTNHGCPTPEDMRVPVLVYDPRATRPRTVEGIVSTLRVAPTLSRLLGVSAPAASRQPPLP
jgi:hypothetical protein